jgi:hypothetical protein
LVITYHLAHKKTKAKKLSQKKLSGGNPELALAAIAKSFPAKKQVSSSM